ncbi:MAG: hypothetical protein ACU0HS_09300 [Paracoccus sp. (in: a-proteobacteria)]|uniref:hypothetical protein n=1 Tax=Paracoccus sp. TaxID=267 RepID=UPI004058B4F9
MVAYSDVPIPRNLTAWCEAVTYAAGLSMLLLLVIVIERHFPVAYVYLISEDKIGEYATSVAFAAAGGVFLASGLKTTRLDRSFLLLLALACIFVAGEEISWGQRIFGIDTPELLRSVNRQGEITLHNIGPLQGADFHEVAGVLLQVLMLASALRARLPRRLAWVDRLSLPPLSLWPASLVVSYVLIAQPMVKGDEIAEAILAFMMLMWSILIGLDLQVLKKGNRSPEAVVALILAAAIAAGAVLSAGFGKNMGWRYNITAARDYPAAGMMEQSRILFQHILAHPDLVQPDTLETYRRIHE